MADPTPGTPAYFKLPQSQRFAEATRAHAQTGGAEVALLYMTPQEWEFIQHAQLPTAAWAQEVQKKFPDQASYLSVPEIADLLHLAAAAPWTASELQSHLQATKWWQSRSQDQRNWFLLNNTDPGQAVASVQRQASSIMHQSQTMGVKISAGQAMVLATNSLQNGWDGQQLNDEIMKQNTQGFTHGTLGATRTHLQGMANQYLMPMSDRGLDAWTQRISTGRADLEGFKDYLVRAAKSRYSDPALQKALDEGSTVADFADPYVQTAASLLGLNPRDIDLQDGKWNAALDYADPKTGAKRSMTLDEWQTQLRTDNRYGYDHSAHGIDQAATLVTGLRQQWGMA